MKGERMTRIKGLARSLDETSDPRVLYACERLQQETGIYPTESNEHNKKKIKVQSCKSQSSILNEEMSKK